MSNSARESRRSPAMRCRSSIRAGILAEHLHTRAHGGPVRRLPHGPGLARRPRPRDDRARARGALPRRRSRPSRPAASATRSFSTPRAERSTISWSRARPAPTGGSRSSSTPRARRSISRCFARNLPANVKLTVRDEAALIALQGPAAAAVLARLAPGRRARSDGVHERRRGGDRRLRGRVSRAPATPARTVSRFRCPPATPRRLPARLLAESRGRADRPRRARHAAARGRPLPLRPRTRRDDRSRSRRASPGRSRSAGASKAAFPARRASSAALADGPGARARRPAAGGPRAGARRRRDRRRSRRARIGVVTSGGFGPSVGAPIAMGYVASAVRRAAIPPSASSCAARALPARVAALPFHPHAYHRG